jgi:hypothetical protein
MKKWFIGLAVAAGLGAAAGVSTVGITGVIVWPVVGAAAGLGALGMAIKYALENRKALEDEIEKIT